MMEGMQLASGMLLVATPALLDPNFADTVVLLLDVNDDGALGVVLNRPIAGPGGRGARAVARRGGRAGGALPRWPGRPRRGAGGRPAA